MTSPAARSTRTQDADSEGEEGKFYVWTEKEIDDVLGAELARRSRAGVRRRPRAATSRGTTSCTASKTDEQDAQLTRADVDEFRGEARRRRKCKLYDVRAKRVWPGRDEKILTAWNGLMIAAFAQAGAAFGEPRYAEAAARAADFVLTHAARPDGRLFRTCGVGQPPKLDAYLEDYAYLVDALVTLYEATFDPQWLAAAVELADVMLEALRGPERRRLLLHRRRPRGADRPDKDLHDGSTPRGNAMAVTALLRLAALTGRRDLPRGGRARRCGRTAA